MPAPQRGPVRNGIDPERPIPETFLPPKEVDPADCPMNDEIRRWLAGPTGIQLHNKSEKGKLLTIEVPYQLGPQQVATFSATPILDSGVLRVHIVSHPDYQSKTFLVREFAAPDRSEFELPTERVEPPGVAAEPAAAAKAKP